MNRWFAPLFTLCAALLYWGTIALRGNTLPKPQESLPEVVVAGPVQLLMYGGDRFLAANIETIRASASATTPNAHDFTLRAHQEVSRLNPCHEDNYWIGNASLSWGGSPDEGFALLRNAVRCRYWDEWPPFFYGFNQYFFLHNTQQAIQSLEEAALRSSDNAAAFRTFTLMLKAGEFDDTRMALKMLQRERDQTKDPTLRGMLEKRVVRLTGLLVLRDAQTTFEKRFKRPLLQPTELLQYGLLETFPEDPLQIGYEFRDHTFHLRQMKPQ